MGSRARHRHPAFALPLAILAFGAACGTDTQTGPAPPQPPPPPPPPPAFSIEAAARPVNGGVVSGEGQKTEGQTARLTAEPSPGYDFVGWSEGGAVVSSSATYTFTVTGDRELSADFAVNPEAGGWAPGGTFSDWFFPGDGLESLEWTFIPVTDPAPSLAQEGLLHFYAYTFSVTNFTPDVGGGYAGFQTNGIFQGSQRGKVVNFSIWGSNGGKSDGWVNPANAESGGYQIMYPYRWTEGAAYRFELRQGPSGVDSGGKWWGLWVTDLATGATTFLGEQRVPDTIDGKDASLMGSHTAMFGEDLHWWRALPGSENYVCSDFEPSAMAARDISANGGTVLPERATKFTNSGGENDFGGHLTENCFVTTYQNDAGDVQHNLGFWPDPAPRGIDP